MRGLSCATTPGTAAPSRWVLILVLYLSGLFMGALDTGIITPARTIIQSDLGVDEKTGIWMITVYTLVISVRLPEYWLHPFGPVLKNIPIIAMIIALHELERGRRWNT